MPFGETLTKLALKMDVEGSIAHMIDACRFNQVTLFLVRAEGSFPQHF